MKPNPKAILPVILLLALVSYGVYYVLTHYAAGQGLVVSGTIEAVEVHLGTQTGGLVRKVYAAEGEMVSEGQVLVEIKPPSGVTERVYSPIGGVVLTRAIEPGEIATPGGTLLVVGDLRTLTLTVYVPEDRYGQIALGQTYPVSVDSFPGQAFPGVVTYIAGKAEFTPRNVQTVQGRKNTVYAVRLALDNPNLALKPGMPADVRLGRE
ncbi:MAG TPA: efflux RND transporter periplasmic adaptor subunit [Anaerolineaceae bacterium]